MNNTFLLFSCYITRSDPQLCARSNQFDQITIAANAIALLTLCLVSTLAWTVFFASFLTTWKALPLGLLCALIIAQVEAAIAASDWELAGVLRHKPPSVASCFRITIRLLIAWVLAQATAVGVTLNLYAGAIQNRLQNQRTAQNVEVEKEYATRRDELRSRFIGSLDKELEAAQKARLLSEEALRRLQVQRNAAQDRSAAAYIEAGRELNGLNRPKGPGERYNDANRQRDVAERLQASTTEEINQESASLIQLNSRIEKLNEQKKGQGIALQTAEEELEEEKRQDPRWVPKHDDPLLRYIALQELKQDAVYGQAVEQFDLLAKIVLVTFELMFLLTKVVFAPSSVYLVRLIAQTKLEAARVAAELESELSEINRNRRQPDLRVVSSN
ncbi:MAG: DUF4407 domain-containing protein [Pseudomonadota bacterium]|nr:DUF4407 domain-containing protein [Pseudomonadota bacterium]